MDAAIITSIISSVCTLIGVIITVVVSGKKQKTEMELQQKYQQREIEEIKKQLETHNNYAVQIPVMQSELSFIRESLGEIKKKVGA